MGDPDLFFVQSRADSPEGLGFCKIKKEIRKYGKTIFICTSNLFEKVAHLIGEHACDGVSILFGYNGKDEWDKTTADMLDFDLIRRPAAIEFLVLRGSGGLNEDFDTKMFERFSQLKYLWLETVKLKHPILEAFPQLQALTIDLSTNKWGHMIGSCENIRHVRADKFSGPMTDLIGEQTETLFLYYPRIKDFDQIVHAPNLKTLYIYRSKTNLDIFVLSMNSHLENLKIEKCPHVNGWERLRANNLKVFGG